MIKQRPLPISGISRLRPRAQESTNRELSFEHMAVSNNLLLALVGPPQQPLMPAFGPPSVALLRHSFDYSTLRLMPRFGVSRGLLLQW
jgi:hypothetical protein